MVDKAVAQITQTLEQRGLLENTFIFLSSDNGGSHQSYANNGPLSVYKYCIADGGIKVPMFVSWPKGFSGGKRLDALVTHRDIFATIADITGANPKKALDAKSLLPLIEGKVDELHQELFWDTGKDSWAYRDGDWKLLLHFDAEYDYYELGEDGLVKDPLNRTWLKQGYALYNLKDDVGETKNLIDQFPDRVAVMKQRYTDWRATMSDPKRPNRK